MAVTSTQKKSFTANVGAGANDAAGASLHRNSRAGRNHSSGAEREAVDEAKRRLREAAAGFDPYALVRARPLACTGSAFLLGLSWHWVQPKGMASGMAVFALQSLSKVLSGSFIARLKTALVPAPPASGEKNSPAPQTAMPQASAPQTAAHKAAAHKPCLSRANQA